MRPYAEVSVDEDNSNLGIFDGDKGSGTARRSGGCLLCGRLDEINSATIGSSGGSEHKLESGRLGAESGQRHRQKLKNSDVSAQKQQQGRTEPGMDAVLFHQLRRQRGGWWKQGE